MGRPKGGGIYEGDTALDYVLTILYRFERELAYWFSPEKIANEGGWLALILPVIEATLLFDGHNMGSSVINEPQAVLRWRESFLGVWDGDWRGENTYFLYNDPDYRKQHRPAIIAMFDRLQSIAVFWQAVGNDSRETELTPLHPDYPLPYFSIKRYTHPNNQEIITVERFTNDLLESLLKDIIYYLSPEKRAVDISSVGEEVWVAADVLAFFCNTYEQTPRVNEELIRTWRETTKQLDDDWDETDGLYQEVMSVFNRLEAVARKYPPMEW
jgi:hypothetical protein